MKPYFLQFDFWNSDMNKFFYGIVDVDLKSESLNEVCRRLIKEMPEGIDALSCDIKINSFNNIE